MEMGDTLRWYAWLMALMMADADDNIVKINVETWLRFQLNFDYLAGMFVSRASFVGCNPLPVDF